MWKVYFWIYLVFTVLNTLVLSSRLQTFTFAAWEGIVESIMLLLGAYSFAYKKYIFDAKAWKLIFFYLVIVWTLGTFYYLGLNLGPINIFFNMNIDISIAAITLTLLLAFPALLAIYLLKEEKHSIKKHQKN